MRSRHTGGDRLLGAACIDALQGGRACALLPRLSRVTSVMSLGAGSQLICTRAHRASPCVFWAPANCRLPSSPPGKYLKLPEKLNIILKVCMMPFMLIAGLWGLSTRAADYNMGPRPWKLWSSPECQEWSA